MKPTSPVMSFVHGCRRRATHEAVRGLLYFSKFLGTRPHVVAGKKPGLDGGPVAAAATCGQPDRGRLEASRQVLDRYFRLMGTWAGWSLGVYQQGFMASGVGARVHVDSTVEHLDRRSQAARA